MYIIIVMTGENKGFTLIEVLVAVFIMSIGFLALSQMQYLSFRQTQLAHSGTTATNLIQAFSDSDLSRIRMIDGLNQNLVTRLSENEEIGNNDPVFAYCSTSPCNGSCPCDPFRTILERTDQDNTFSSCMGIDIDNNSIDSPIYSTDSTDCGAPGSDYFLVRTIDLRVDNNIRPPQRTYNIEYSVKSPGQLRKNGFNAGISLATNTIEIVAYVDTTTLASAPDDIERILIIPNIP